MTMLSSDEADDMWHAIASVQRILRAGADALSKSFYPRPREGAGNVTSSSLRTEWFSHREFRVRTGARLILAVEATDEEKDKEDREDRGNPPAELLFG